MQTLFKHEASGVELCRELARPDITSFTELFPVAELQKPKRNPNWRPERKTLLNIGSYCSRGWSEHRPNYQPALYVTCAGWLHDWLCENMIVVEYDEIFFEVVDHGEWSLVLANYNQILGSRWLAYVKTDTIPFQA